MCVHLLTYQTVDVVTHSRQEGGFIGTLLDML